MDPREMDALVQRLVQNPHDQDAILHAHSAGQQDPRGYAILLEKVGTATVDAALASHWLTEAANVWVLSLNDAHRAARALMIAIDRDPTQPVAAERLAELYREKGDTKALAALLERRAKALTPLAQREPTMRVQIAGIHEELGRLWAEPPLSNPSKAIENYRRALDYDPGSQYAIYSIREALKSAGQVADAIPYYALEQQLVDDPERKVSLYADEAEARKSIGDVEGALAALEGARRVDPADPGLKQQLATIVLDGVRDQENLDAEWKAIGAQLFVELAEEYQGEHGFAYSACALEIQPGHDRAVQLAMFYGEQLGRTAEVVPFAASYLRENPDGALAEEARRLAGDVPASGRAASRPEASRPGGHGPAASRPAGSRPAASRPAGSRPAASRPAASEPAITEARRVDPADRTLDDLEGDSSIEDVPEGEDGEAGDATAAPPSELSALELQLDKAQKLASKNRKNEAAGVYREVLKADPVHPEAIAFLQTHLRQARKFGDLRDVLVRAARSPRAVHEDKVSWYREVAGLCEAQIRDYDTAIQAFQQVVALEPGDDTAREQLGRLLERAQRWDDLAQLLEQEAEQQSDVEARLATEKQLAKLHETKRKDPVAAGHAWARISALTPEDDTVIATAVKLFEKGERPDLAAQVIADNVGSVADEPSRANLYVRLGELRRASGDLAGAGEAYSEAARLTQSGETWATAERAFAEAQSWARAAEAVNERAELATTARQRAELLGLEAAYRVRSGELDTAIERLEQAVDADPTDDAIAGELEAQLRAADRLADVAALFTRRADKHPHRGPRGALRKRAAQIYRETLGDPAAARECLERALEDGDDVEALSLLSSDAEEREDFAEAVEYLERLESASAPGERAAVALRRARLLAEGVQDAAAAIEQYERVLSALDPKNQEALTAIADLEETRGDHRAAAGALERLIAVVSAPEPRVEIARRLAEIYEVQLDEPRAAMRAYDAVYAADRDDFQALQKIVELGERLEEWEIVAEHLVRLLEVEGDEEEVSRMTLRLADILTDRLDRGEEALKALASVGDLGDGPCREAFVELGDRLGQKKQVASKLVEWFGHAPPSAERELHLNGAFERFVATGSDAEAAAIAKELARMRIARPAIAEALEAVAVRLRDLDALALAHDLVARPLSGPSRAEELVRQAEVLSRVGVDPLEAVQHGERALTSVAPDEAEPLLERLARLLDEPAPVIDLYERQIGRCKAPDDRLTALARAAQVAAERDDLTRSRRFFDLALSSAAADATIERLEKVARSTDEARGDRALRTTLAEALAAGGQGSRDGGRTRGAFLRRAAIMAFRELGDPERAFGWIGDSLVTHVDDAGLDALSELADEVRDVGRADAVITRALSEVFDGPLVRKLLARRADLRANRLGDRRAAAEDLRRLHELAPADTEVMDKLSALYTELEDYRGMVQLYEDQILRGRDQALRAELARKVARLWEERLDDAREAADAWRRVLRMKAGDGEATLGLERAKSNMLKRTAPAEEAGEVGQPAPPVAPLPPSPVPDARRAALRPAAAPPADEAVPARADDDGADAAEPMTSPVPTRVSAATDVDAGAAPPPLVAPPASEPGPVTPEAPPALVSPAVAAAAPDADDRRDLVDDDDEDIQEDDEEDPPTMAPWRAVPPVEAAPAEEEDMDIDVDVSLKSSLPPPVRRPVPPPPKGSPRSRPPPPPPSAKPRSSTPPPLPAAKAAPPAAGSSRRSSLPPPLPGAKPAPARAPRAALAGAAGEPREESEEVVDDEELF